MSVETDTTLPAMLTVEQVAAAFHCNQRTVQRKCFNGEIPGAVKIWGDRWLISRESVIELLTGDSA